MLYVHEEYGVLTDDDADAVLYCQNCLKHGIPLRIYGVDSDGTRFVPNVKIVFKMEEKHGRKKCS